MNEDRERNGEKIEEINHLAQEVVENGVTGSNSWFYANGTRYTVEIREDVRKS